MAEINQQNKNVSKIKGNSNYVWQGSHGSSEAEIEGHNNTSIQGADFGNAHEKANGWTKTGVIGTIIGVLVAILTLYFTYILNKEQIDSWFSSL